MTSTIGTVNPDIVAASQPLSPPYGASASNSMCNAHGQTHDIANLFISDGGQLTTGPAENPTLTIATVAIRRVDYVAGQMSARAI